MKTVLVIDGNEYMQSVVERTLSAQFKVFQAKTLKEVQKFLRINTTKIDVILISRFLNDSEKTDNLLVNIKNSNFSGRIISFWNESDDMEIQLEIGCTHEISKTNPGLVAIKLNRILEEKKSKVKAL